MQATNGIDEEKEMNEEERLRNKFGETELYTRDPNQAIKLPSPLPEFMEDLSECFVKRQVYHLPPYPPGVGHPFRLLKNVKTGKGAPPGIPTFDSLPFECRTQVLGVNVFGNSSRFVLKEQKAHNFQIF